MGNNPSKKAGKDRPKSLPARLELPDNDYSTNTASSVSSILINSQNSYNRNNQQQQQQQQQQQSALSQLNPNYPTGRKGSPPPGATSGGPETESPDDTTTDNDVDSNQLTVNSINQLTVSSMISINGKTMDIDDYIRRLLEAGYASKVSKQLCLKNSEVTAICRAAMDVFLSQPVSSIIFTPKEPCSH
jgi:serine/threonine-protein phosphatase PP1 catalytic subunit